MDCSRFLDGDDTGGVEGSNTGTVGYYWFYKVADGTEGTATQTFTHTGSSSVWEGEILQARSSTGTYDVSSGGYSINGNTTAWGGTLDTDIGMTNGDLVLLAGATVGNAATTTGEGITANDINVKSAVNEHGEFSSSLGYHVRIVLATTLVWEGTNTSTPAVTWTENAAVSGAVSALRIRQGTGPNRTDTWVRAGGKQVAGGATVKPAYPEHDIGDMLTAHAGTRDATDPVPSTPAGWTYLGSYTGGQGTFGRIQVMPGSQLFISRQLHGIPGH